MLEWEVLNILDSSQVNHGCATGQEQNEYLVKWQVGETSWEPTYNVIPGCKELVWTLRRNRPEAVGPNITYLVAAILDVRVSNKSYMKQRPEEDRLEYKVK